MDYVWHKFSRGFPVASNLISPQLEKLVKQKQKCIGHKLYYALENIHYRLYRRGKNRCLHCGVKLNQE